LKHSKFAKLEKITKQQNVVFLRSKNPSRRKRDEIPSVIVCFKLVLLWVDKPEILEVFSYFLGETRIQS
jgi:hypothetical protein